MANENLSPFMARFQSAPPVSRGRNADDSLSPPCIFRFNPLPRFPEGETCRVAACQRTTSVSIRSPGFPREKPRQNEPIISLAQVSIRSPGFPREKHKSTPRPVFLFRVSIRSPGFPREKRFPYISPFIEFVVSIRSPGFPREKPFRAPAPLVTFKFQSAPPVSRGRNCTTIFCLQHKHFLWPLREPHDLDEVHCKSLQIPDQILL